MRGSSPKKINRRDIVRLAAGLFAPRAAMGANEGPGKLSTFDYAGVRLLDGRQKSQFQTARDFYINIPNDNLLLGFRQRAGLSAPGKALIGWYGGNPAGPGQTTLTGGDTFHAFGQFLSGMSRMAKATNDDAMRDKVSELITEWVKTIEPDGYFYYSRRPNSYHYTYEKTLCGLVDAHLYCGNREAMHHLERITAWADKNLDRSKPAPLKNSDSSGNGQEWYTLPENLYRAWQITGERHYRDFASQWHYPDYWGMFNGAVPLNPYGRHAYSHVNTLSSAAMAHIASGDPAYFNTITGAYDWLQKTQVYATGGFGPGERMMKPDGSLGKELEGNANTFETVCGSWAIFKLGRYLISLTGEARYGDWMEKALYNGIGAVLPMNPDGWNFYYSDYRLGGGRKIYNALWRWSCCSGTYPQSIADYYNIIYFKGPQALYVNLYVPSEVSWEGVTLKQDTAYPESPSSSFTIQTDAEKTFALRFRIPGWCEGASLRVNGQAHTATCRHGEWAVVNRVWKNGDRVILDLPMKLSFAAVDEQHPKRAALVYGPVVLVKRQNSSLEAALQSIEKIGDGLSFQVSESSESQFAPFSTLHYGEPYEMYFDL